MSDRPIILPPEVYVRQRDILPHEVLQKATVTVIGVGAIGSFVAFSLAKMGVGTIHVYDHDSVEPHNLPQQWYRLKDLTRKKTDALSELLSEFGGNVVSHPEKFVAQPLKGIVICAVDSMDARILIWRHIKKSTKVDLFIDGRMGAEVGKVHVVRPTHPDDIKRYEEDLYPSSEAFQAPCTARSTIYCATGLSAFMVAAAAGYLSGRKVRPFMVVDFRNALMISPEEEQIAV